MAARYLAAAAAIGLWAAPAMALSPAELFEKVSPSVWAVRALDGSGRAFGFGSGVVIGPGRMITNCHVLAKAKAVQVRRENVSYDASLEHADAERDLCTLAINGFSAPAVQIKAQAELKVGQRVYAVGNPLRLALTLSEGLVSGLRSEDPKLPPIQTSAAISQGSSGGGLFDEEGRLIGITTLIVIGRDRIAQNLNFAMPAEWIAEVPERAKAALAARRGATPAMASTSGTPASPALPAPGATYRYSLSDHQYFRGQNEFTVRVTDVIDWNVSDSLIAAGAAAVPSVISAREVSFSSRRMADGRSAVELAPYLPVDSPAPSWEPNAVLNYPTDAHGAWTISILQQDWDQVDVPAGSFRAMRVAINGSREIPNVRAGQIIAQTIAKRFLYTVWYAPDVKRYVKARHQVWNVLQSPVVDDHIELLEYLAK